MVQVLDFHFWEEDHQWQMQQQEVNHSGKIEM
jgi:hypothetical protein